MSHPFEGTIENPDGGAFVRSLGLGDLHLADGLATLEFTVAPPHLNPGAIAHGGLLSAVADWLTGEAVHSALAADRYAPHATLNMQFVRGAQLGWRLLCSARCTSMGSRAATAEAEFRAGEKLIARAMSTHVLVERRIVT